MVVIEKARKEDLRAALGHIMYRPGVRPAQIDDQVNALLRYGEKYQLQMDECLVAKDGARILSACLCVDSPGRISAVFLPQMSCGHTDSEALVELLREADRRGRNRKLLYLQGLVEPEETPAVDVYQAAGFSFLARLIYLENDLTRPVLADKQIPELRWVTYEAHTHTLFSEAIQRTYEGSLDCARLNGVREIEDILAAHRSTGRFNPSHWYVGMRGERPVGVVLLAYIPERYVYEVVYTGLLPEYRHQGYGKALLARAVDSARDEGVDKLTLTVDEINEPARGLYANFGFEEAARRDAWVRLFVNS